MNGNELFEFNDKKLDYSLSDFWRFQYSNIYNLHGEIAEFIVAQALGITKAQNSAYWTLWDISYRGIRVEVKATAYYHPWNNENNISKRRVFGITKANGSYDSKVSGNHEFCRQNDIYVFCLNNGTTKETSYPLNLDNWEFYIVPTKFINKNCPNNKTISLGRIKNFGFRSLSYDQIKSEIDCIIDTNWSLK